MARGHRRKDAVETPAKNPTFPQPPVPTTDELMRALFAGPRKANDSAKETK